MSATLDNAARPESVIARFVNLGAALVELHTARFLTKWTAAGPPWHAARPYEVDGWNWWCTGCGEYGRDDESYDDPAFRKLADARSGAQEHSEKCRAVPPRAEAAGWEYLTASFREKWVTLDDVLAQHGPQGWELVAVHWNAHQAVFKRPAGGVS